MLNAGKAVKVTVYLRELRITGFPFIRASSTFSFTAASPAQLS